MQSQLGADTCQVSEFPLTGLPQASSLQWAPFLGGKNPRTACDLTASCDHSGPTQNLGTQLQPLPASLKQPESQCPHSGGSTVLQK